MTPAAIPARLRHIRTAEVPVRERCASTRADAARWHWVREAWYAQRERPLAACPDRYHLPEETLFAGLRALLYGDIPTRHHLGYRPPGAGR